MLPCRSNRHITNQRCWMVSNQHWTSPFQGGVILRMVTNQSCWSVPFFGALSALARRLSELRRDNHLLEDPCLGLKHTKGTDRLSWRLFADMGMTPYYPDNIGITIDHCFGIMTFRIFMECKKGLKLPLPTGIWKRQKMGEFGFKIPSHSIHVWYIYLHLPYFTIKKQPNVGKYTIHGWYGCMIYSNISALGKQRYFELVDLWWHLEDHPSWASEKKTGCLG